VLNFKILT